MNVFIVSKAMDAVNVLYLYVRPNYVKERRLIRSLLKPKSVQTENATGLPQMKMLCSD